MSCLPIGAVAVPSTSNPPWRFLFSSVRTIPSRLSVRASSPRANRRRHASVGKKTFPWFALDAFVINDRTPKPRYSSSAYLPHALSRSVSNDRGMRLASAELGPCATLRPSTSLISLPGLG